MLNVSFPTNGATVPTTGFSATGTCPENHRVNVRLTMTSTSQYRDYNATGVQGRWTTSVFPWAPGSYSITVTCEGMTDSITVSLAVGSATNPNYPGSGP